MSKREFKQAPVSEVVIGITFKKKVMDLRQFFDFSQVFKEEFPILEIKNPLANQKLVDFKHITEIDDNDVGPFRLFQRNKKGDYLIQYQANKILLNWIRKDNEEVGIYPGFTAIKNKFYTVINKLVEFIDGLEDSDVDYYDLTYLDRVVWQDYIDDFSSVAELINMIPPLAHVQEINNISSQYTYKLERVNGYGLLDLKTTSTIEEKQILKFQYTVRGSDLFSNKDSWYNEAHKNQIIVFKEFFNHSILEKWK